MARESERQERVRKDAERAEANARRQTRPTEAVLLRAPKSSLSVDEAADLATPAPAPKKPAAKRSTPKKPAAKRSTPKKPAAFKPKK